jgi:hypothetical protein
MLVAVIFVVFKQPGPLGNPLQFGELLPPEEICIWKPSKLAFARVIAPLPPIAVYNPLQANDPP